MRIKQRALKRTVIILIYLAIFGFFAWLIYFVATYSNESCSDKIKNQNEEDVDCGGVCAQCKKIVAQDLNVLKASFIENGTQDRVDVLAEIENPNSKFGSKKFEYQFDFEDSEGNILSSRSGESFILPGEKKYIIENNVAIAQLTNLKLKILTSEWVEFDNVYENPQMKIINKHYDEMNSGSVFGEAVGILKNESPFDFNLIKIKVILRNGEDEILALNSTEMRTVKSGEEREFKALWPNKFPGAVSKMEVQSEVNIFESDAYAERYYQPQKFQQSF